MPRKIEIIDDNIIVRDNDTITAIAINDENPFYQQIKKETNNFTENMEQKSEIELLTQTQTDLIFQLMMNGVI